MISDLKYFDGSLARIDRVPDELKARYATAFEIDPRWLIEAAARRQKWIDQAQSLNLYLALPSGQEAGSKTTYYLRTLGASQMEKTGTESWHRQWVRQWRTTTGALTSLNSRP
jgi:ribonucleoside-diphosphate reductase alpha chain